MRSESCIWVLAVQKQSDFETSRRQSGYIVPQVKMRRAENEPREVGAHGSALPA